MIRRQPPSRLCAVRCELWGGVGHNGRLTAHSTAPGASCTRWGGGFSLVEVLIVAFLALVFILPFYWLFSHSVRWSARDLQQLRATVLATEVMEQIIGVHRHMGSLFAIPPTGLSAGDELDLDAHAARYGLKNGFPLFPGRHETAMPSRCYLSTLPAGFRRQVRIQPRAVGLDLGPATTPPVLHEVQVRISYPVSTGQTMVSGEQILRTYLFQDRFQRRP